MRAIHVSPHLLLSATALFWGAHWIVARAIVPHISPMGMSFWRWTVAILVLAPFAWPHLVRDRAKLAAAWKAIFFFGLIGTVLYNAMGYLALTYTSATNALLLQSLTPGLIPVIAFAIFREEIRARTAAGLCISLLGVLAIIFRLDAAALLAFRFNTGDLLLIVSVGMWALYTACLRWAPRDVHPLGLFLAVMLAGMTGGVPAYAIDLAMGGRAEWNAGVLAGIAYLGIFPSVVCYVLWSKGVAAIGSARAGAYLHGTPLAGVSMAIVFLGERIEAFHVVGFVLILAGVWLAAGARRSS